MSCAPQELGQHGIGMDRGEFSLQMIDAIKADGGMGLNQLRADKHSSCWTKKLPVRNGPYVRGKLFHFPASSHNEAEMPGRPTQKFAEDSRLKKRAVRLDLRAYYAFSLQSDS